MTPQRTCRGCSIEFIPHPKKPGNINDCPDCSVEVVKPLMAKVSYPSKNASEVEITITSNIRDAQNFNNAQKHHWSKAY